MKRCLRNLMTGRKLMVALLAVVVVGIPPAQAEYRGQTRDQAKYVVVGTVQEVHTSEGNGYRNYRVEIRIEHIEKGAGLAGEDTLEVSCSRPIRKGGRPTPGPSGHKAPPSKGQRIKAFIIDGPGGKTGVYPNWYDVLPE
jgi:hypothetical protein